jgi:hypothetical protein
MSNIALSIDSDWKADATPPGVTTASLMAATLVSTLVGAVAGMAFGGTLSLPWLAIAAGLIGTLAAALVRNTVLIRAWEAAGVVDAGMPAAVVTYAAVASLAGSLAASQLIGSAGPVPAPVIGMLAGLLSAGLMGLLMVSYRMQPPKG